MPKDTFEGKIARMKYILVGQMLDGDSLEITHHNYNNNDIKQDEVITLFNANTDKNAENIKTNFVKQDA